MPGLLEQHHSLIHGRFYLIGWRARYRRCCCRKKRK
jgi:hypothetical protein